VRRRWGDLCAQGAAVDSAVDPAARGAPRFFLPAGARLCAARAPPRAPPLPEQKGKWLPRTARRPPPSRPLAPPPGGSTAREIVGGTMRPFAGRARAAAGRPTYARRQGRGLAGGREGRGVFFYRRAPAFAPRRAPPRAPPLPEQKGKWLPRTARRPPPSRPLAPPRRRRRGRGRGRVLGRVGAARRLPGRDGRRGTGAAALAPDERGPRQRQWRRRRRRPAGQGRRRGRRRRSS